jgi:hypothetical protein
MAPAPGRCRMGACETTPTTTHTTGKPAHPTPGPRTHNQQALPRPRSSAAAGRRQARSSSPAPCRALWAPGAPAGPRTTRRHEPAAREEGQHNSPTQSPAARGHQARPARPLDKQDPHGCGDGLRWTCCRLFASRGSGVRAPLAPQVRSKIRTAGPVVQQRSTAAPSDEVLKARSNRAGLIPAAVAKARLLQGAEQREYRTFPSHAACHDERRAGCWIGGFRPDFCHPCRRSTLVNSQAFDVT